MPQFRAQPPNKDVAARLMRDKVREGVPDGSDYLDVTHQIRRLGVDAVRDIAAAQGVSRSKRTIRRWRQYNCFPKALSTVETLVRRQDQLQRLAERDHPAAPPEQTPTQAAQSLNMPPTALDRYRTDPNYTLPAATQNVLAGADVAQSRASVGIPVNRNTGDVLRSAKLKARGQVWVKGDTGSDEYRAHRNVDIQLDKDTTNAILTATEEGDYDAARAAAEEFLSTHHAGCAGYDDNYGWHFDDLDDFDLDFN
ncbi:MAG: hypothetical protein J2P17_01355 [Mycobacterium sp.]|nr:hypothetical protein [Mycobacterium sp.]